MLNQEVKGIIFDMDNTLLQSKINFPAMKEAVFQFLLGHGFFEPGYDWKRYTASQLIEKARMSTRMENTIEEEIWRTVARFEEEGMHGASLEPGMADLLAVLHERCCLVVLTNNAHPAAETALRETGIAKYFDYIAGREQVQALKPSSLGVQHILGRYPHIRVTEWLFVGDSWIDGKAAQDGNVRFAAYGGNREEMEGHGVLPAVYLAEARELLRYVEGGYREGA
ncbi:HAD family hydrolase [Aneurinibacillus tyrosinisolvens]|uniref:HAD family hydrolase n=1 Tax=Aneurinibacillus tyrosinisolvens TaxID=1443435 RepID=UPI00063F18B3|nr:HAD-IA family hydrolase [Aneurinibacillus tyrosinisolvens]